MSLQETERVDLSKSVGISRYPALNSVMTGEARGESASVFVGLDACKQAEVLDEEFFVKVLTSNANLVM